MKSRIQNIATYYNRQFEKQAFDTRVELHGWESQTAQRERFAVLDSFLTTSDLSILDVGCGAGDLYSYLFEKHSYLRYYGVDILQDMVEKAKERYPDGVFLQKDIFADPMFNDNQFDVVFSSGIFNLNLGNNFQFLENAMMEFVRIAKRLVVFTLLHERSPDKERCYFYYSPDKVSTIAEKFCSDLTLVDHYLENDFAVIIYKDA